MSEYKNRGFQNTPWLEGLQDFFKLKNGRLYIGHQTLLRLLPQYHRRAEWYDRSAYSLSAQYHSTLPAGTSLPTPPSQSPDARSGQRHVGLSNHFHAELTHHIQRRLRKRQLNPFDHARHVSGLALSATSSARSGAIDYRQFVDELLERIYALSISCSVRRRRFSISALIRNTVSRSRIWASAS